MKTKPSARQTATLLMAVCAILWSLGGIIIKLPAWHLPADLGRPQSARRRRGGCFAEAPERRHKALHFDVFMNPKENPDGFLLESFPSAAVHRKFSTV